MNNVPRPHYLLYSDSISRGDDARWRFVLQRADGSESLTAASDEPDVRGERLELLAVVRGLEALDQPSEVTIYTSSRYVDRGLREALDVWRRSGWCWEAHGEMVPIRNVDLWQRLDRALEFHDVEVHRRRSTPATFADKSGRRWRFDAAHAEGRGARSEGRGTRRRRARGQGARVGGQERAKRLQ